MLVISCLRISVAIATCQLVLRLVDDVSVANLPSNFSSQSFIDLIRVFFVVNALEVALCMGWISSVLASRVGATRSMVRLSSTLLMLLSVE